MILDIAVVSTTLIVIALSFSAIGAVFYRTVGGRIQGVHDGFLAFWIGFATVTWFLILWNFVLPIDSTALFAVMLVSAVCCAISAPAVVRALRQSGMRPGIDGAIMAVALLWLASQCLAPFRSWDGVLYHIQNVAWAKAHPVIPGIANLDARLAFNNSSFLYDALVDSWILEGRGFHFANSTLIMVSVLQSLWAGLRWRREGSVEHSPRLFEFLLLPIALYYLPEITTYSTDLPMALLSSAALGCAFSAIVESSRGSRPISREKSVVVTLLFGAAVAMKLTAAVFAATALVVVLWRQRRQAWIWSAMTVVVFLGPWVARGIVMSGYPLFPLPYFGLPLDWRAPVELARGEVAYIGYTEREFSWHFVGRGWVYLTFVRNTGAILIPALVSAATCLLWWRHKRASRAHGPTVGDWWLAVPPLVAIAAWLPSAPSHRYGAVIFWALAAVCVTNWMLVASRTLTARTSTLWLAAVAIAVSPLVAATASTVVFDKSTSPMVTIRKTLIGGWQGPLPPLPTHFPVRTFFTTSGFQMNTPEPRANLPDSPNSCGNAPLPCTATPAANLELRDPGRIERGFRTNGDWNMANWPYPWRPDFLREWNQRRNGG